MKKFLAILALLACLVIGFTDPAVAGRASYLVSIDTTSAGTTTSTQDSGTSTMYFDLSTSRTYKEIDRDWAWTVVDVTTLTGETDAPSGNTFGVSYAVAMETGDISSAEKHYVWYQEPHSGDTIEARWIRIPMGRYIQWYFHPSGVSAWTSARFRIMHGGESQDWMSPESVRLGTTQSYYLQSTSGASSLSTVPEGAREAVVRVTGDDIRYFVDATDCGANDGMELSYTQTLTLYSQEQMDDFRFCLKSGGSGTTVYVDYYTLD